MQIEGFLREYQRKLLANDNDFKTAKVYLSCVGLFLNFYQTQYDSPLHISIADIENYLIYLKEKNYSSSYQNQFIAATKQFFKINGQPQKCNKLIYRKTPQKTPNVLVYNECMAMCNAKIYIKHKAIINLLYYGALRLSEVINLKIEHISRDGRITIVASKFGKSRIIPIPKLVMEILREYYKSYNPKIYLFNGDGGKGTKYSARSIQNIVKDTARKVGIYKKVHPHLLRASCATILLDNGATEGYVSNFLGHSKVQTTHDYYHRLTISAMQNQFENIFLKLSA